MALEVIERFKTSISGKALECKITDKASEIEVIGAELNEVFVSTN